VFAARTNDYCFNIPVLIIKEKHGLVGNPSFPLDLLEMLGLVSPAGEYFLHTVTMCKQYSLSMRFLKPKKHMLQEELSKNTKVCRRGGGGQLKVHRIGHTKFDGIHNQIHYTLGHCYWVRVVYRQFCLRKYVHIFKEDSRV
jgi:hypothetical protein